MLDKLWDFLVDSAFAFFVPLVCSYFALTSNLFLNTACEEAAGFEKLGNALLTPCHYLFLGQTAKREANGEWSFSDRFIYTDGRFASKTILCSIAAIPSFLVGVPIKALSLLTEEARNHHRSMHASRTATKTNSNEALYLSYGIDLRREREWFKSEGHQRRSGDENNMAAEKGALREIAALLTQANIPWWIDCGTCLGAYRYGGVIPWDQDVDIAVFQIDFENVRHALNGLDSNQYIVQDWSSRDHPKSYLKVYVRESGAFIDVYNFKIVPEKKQIHYLLSLENNFFLPDWWKHREKKFTAPVSFDVVFPLKKALFDGIEVNVPNDVKAFLQRYYGDNLSPSKIYDPITQRYEKDLSHPYWQRLYAH
jgi:hypothetical protein